MVAQETPFTPGPWSAQPACDDADGRPMYWYVVQGEDPLAPAIASTWGEVAYHERNARLMAASPDMVATLREIADAADEFESASRDHRSRVTNNRLLSAIDQARAALAKAGA